MTSAQPNIRPEVSALPTCRRVKCSDTQKHIVPKIGFCVSMSVVESSHRRLHEHRALIAHRSQQIEWIDGLVTFDQIGCLLHADKDARSTNTLQQLPFTLIFTLRSYRRAMNDDRLQTATAHSSNIVDKFEKMCRALGHSMIRPCAVLKLCNESCFASLQRSNNCRLIRRLQSHTSLLRTLI